MSGTGGLTFSRKELEKNEQEQIDNFFLWSQFFNRVFRDLLLLKIQISSYLFLWKFQTLQLETNSFTSAEPSARVAFATSDPKLEIAFSIRPMTF